MLAAAGPVIVFRPFSVDELYSFPFTPVEFCFYRDFILALLS